jgi:hypothetical protein
LKSASKASGARGDYAPAVLWITRLRLCGFAPNGAGIGEM